MRLFIAGVRQTTQPGFTSEKVFGIPGTAAHPLVREIGFANLSMGTLAIAGLWVPAWRVPAALAGGLYYGLASLVHIRAKGTNHRIALWSDLFAFAVLAAFVIASLQ